MWGGAYACRAISSSGGAAAHTRILRAAADAAGLTDVTVIGPDVPVEALASPYHGAYTYTYARIQRFPRELGLGGATAWRIAEFLGSDPAPAPPPTGEVSALERIDTLLLVDHAQGYRDRPGNPSLRVAQ